MIMADTMHKYIELQNNLNLTPAWFSDTDIWVYKREQHDDNVITDFAFGCFQARYTRHSIII